METYHFWQIKFDYQVAIDTADACTKLTGVNFAVLKPVYQELYLVADEDHLVKISKADDTIYFTYGVNVSTGHITATALHLDKDGINWSRK